MRSCRSVVINAIRRDIYLLFQGAGSELWYRPKQKPAAVRYLMGVSDIREKQRKFYFVTVNSNTSRDQAGSSMSCYYSLHSCLRYKKSSSGFRMPVSDIGECPIIIIDV